MRIDRHEDGATCWVDLATPDASASADFYGDLLGWTTVEGPPETGGYRQAFVGDSVVAGIMNKMDPAQPTAWTVYFRTSDADATAAKIVAAGGTVLAAPMDVMAFGRMGIFSDPQGAVFGIWQPDELEGHSLVGEPGAWAWSELLTSDLDGASAFYHDVFGWSSTEGSSDSADYREMTVGGEMACGLMPRPAEAPASMPNYWGVYFTVADLDATISTVEAAGGQVIAGPMTIAYGTWVCCIDPQGAVIAFLDPNWT